MPLSAHLLDGNPSLSLGIIRSTLNDCFQGVSSYVSNSWSQCSGNTAERDSESLMIF